VEEHKGIKLRYKQKGQSCSMEQIEDRRKKERIEVETNFLKTLLRKQECNSRNVFKDALNYLWIP